MTDENTWVIELDAEGMENPLRVEVDRQFVIGRSIAGKNTVDIDLGPYKGQDRGVSRKHAMIFPANDQLMLTDLGTANGTVVNNERLRPNQRTVMKTGDVIVLGAFRMTMKIISKPPPRIDTTKLTTEQRLSRASKPGKGEIVLIVEDHMDMAQLFSMMLQRQGFITQISRDANRALRFLQTNTPDAVILDLMLPGIDGLEICRYIRRDQRLDAIPVIVISAKKDPNTEQDAIVAGADIFLNKPPNANELGQVVFDQIQERRISSGQLTKNMDVTTLLDQDETLKHAGTPKIDDDTVVFIVAGYTDRPFTVKLNKPHTMGRTRDEQPTGHIDLSQFSASERGVSRIHATVSYDDGRYFIADNGSLNGTYVNGEKIPSNQEVEIFNGHEVRLGTLSMYMYVLSQQFGDHHDGNNEGSDAGSEQSSST